MRGGAHLHRVRRIGGSYRPMLEQQYVHVFQVIQHLVVRTLELIDALQRMKLLCAYKLMQITAVAAAASGPYVKEVSAHTNTHQPSLQPALVVDESAAAAAVASAQLVGQLPLDVEEFV